MTNCGLVRSALSHISPDDREAWFKMGMAVKSELGDDGFSIWDEWSQQADSYDQAAARDSWRSFRGGAITGGTLFHQAKTNGWQDDGTYKGPTPEQLADKRARALENAEKERQKADRAAVKAKEIWKASTPTRSEQPYLVKKQVKPVATLRENELDELVKLLGYHPQAKGVPLEAGRILVVPVKVGNFLTTCEFIDITGSKTALADGKKAGGYWAAQQLPDGDGKGLRLLLGEGVATVLSCREATGYPVVAGLSCGNLLTVARMLRERYPAASLVVLADLGNGQAKAEEAAKAVGGLLAVPDFGPDRSEKATDFNDLHALRGLTAVNACIEAAIAQNGSTGPPPATNWPEPLPLTSHQQADPYPLDALPDTIKAAVREVVDFVQCPVALGACSCLSVVATVAQGLVDVRRAEKLEGPTSLYLLAIADSGERKTTVDGHFKKPVEQWESEQAEAAKPDIKRYEAESAAWDSEKSGLLAAIKEASKSGKSTDELKKRLAVLESAKPNPPKVPRLLFGDSTPEETAYRLAHGWPVGGVLSSEAGNVFGGHAMGKDSAMRNMAMLNSLWGAETLRIDRRTTASFTVSGARLTMGLAVQSETVRTFLEGSKGLARGIGWLARFLIAWPESTQGGRMFRDPPENWAHLEKFNRRLGALLDHPLTFNDRGELEPETLELSPEAKEVWVAFHNDVEAELRPGRDMAEAKDVASKAADNAARLAALFHLFENDPGGTIGPEHMKKAAAVAGWHLYEARRFMGEIALPVEVHHAAKLDAWLLGYCQQNGVEEVSTTTIQQNGPNCTREKRNLTPALNELEEAGRVRVVKDVRRKLVKINPALVGGGHGPA